MADAFSRGRLLLAEANEVAYAKMISPKIRALLAELALAARQREQRFNQALRRTKARAKPAKPRR